MQMIEKDNAGITAYLGRIYTPLASGKWVDIPRGALLVDSKGSILAICEQDKLLTGQDVCTVVDRSDCVIIPGFADCHQHLCHYEWIRLIPDLLEWLNFIYQLEERFQYNSYTDRVARAFFVDLLRNGTTTCCVHGPYFAKATETAFHFASESGLRVLMGMNMGNKHMPNSLTRKTSTLMREAGALCQNWNGANGGLLNYCITVRPAYCASDDLLHTSTRLAKELGVRIHSHLAEDEAAQKKVLDEHPSYTSELEVYDDCGILQNNTIMAHGTYLNQVEYETLCDRGTAIAHCPRASLLAGAKLLDIKMVQGAGVRVGLGTDLGGGKGLSMFRVMEDALKMRPWMSIHDVFHLGTLAGAKALGLDQVTGSLESEKEADFLVVSVRMPTDSVALTDMAIDDVLSSLVFTGDSSNIREVFVKGKRLLSRE